MQSAGLCCTVDATAVLRESGFAASDHTHAAVHSELVAAVCAAACVAGPGRAASARAAACGSICSRPFLAACYPL